MASKQQQGILKQQLWDAADLCEVIKYRASARTSGSSIFRTRAVDVCSSLRNKKDLIEPFVDSQSARGEVDEERQAFVAARRDGELETIIESEGRRLDVTRAFIKTAFCEGSIQTTGTAVTKILPPVSRFAADSSYSEKKQRVLTRLTVFFDRFFGVDAGSD